MRLSIQFLALAAQVTAIDLYMFHSKDRCDLDSGGVAMLQVVPNQCYRPADGVNPFSVLFRAIRKDWKVTGEGFYGGDCKSIKRHHTEEYGGDICLSNDLEKYPGKYTGARYYVTGAGRKSRSFARAEEAACRVDGDPEQPCIEVHTPDLVVLADRSLWNVKGIEHADFQELNELARRGVKKDGIPDKFHGLAAGYMDN